MSWPQRIIITGSVVTNCTNQSFKGNSTEEELPVDKITNNLLLACRTNLKVTAPCHLQQIISAHAVERTTVAYSPFVDEWRQNGNQIINFKQKGQHWCTLGSMKTTMCLTGSHWYRREQPSDSTVRWRVPWDMRLHKHAPNETCMTIQSLQIKQNSSVHEHNSDLYACLDYRSYKLLLAPNGLEQ